jgi:peptidoglycan/LPS O-acetylase OafA/YrhL
MEANRPNGKLVQADGLSLLMAMIIPIAAVAFSAVEKPFMALRRRCNAGLGA